MGRGVSMVDYGPPRVAWVLTGDVTVWCGMSPTQVRISHNIRRVSRNFHRVSCNIRDRWPDAQDMGWLRFSINSVPAPDHLSI